MNSAHSLLFSSSQPGCLKCQWTWILPQSLQGSSLRLCGMVILVLSHWRGSMIQSSNILTIHLDTLSWNQHSGIQLSLVQRPSSTWASSTCVLVVASHSSNPLQDKNRSLTLGAIGGTQTWNLLLVFSAVSMMVVNLYTGRSSPSPFHTILGWVISSFTIPGIFLGVDIVSLIISETLFFTPFNWSLPLQHQS